MSGIALRKLLREWAAMIAVLAMALGPLALAASRSLGAADRIAAASGVQPLALCLPGAADAGAAEADPAGAPHGQDCDHCTPAQHAVQDSPEPQGLPARAATAAGPSSSPIRMAAFPRAPPARGPPAA
jgi:hypothetical protein